MREFHRREPQLQLNMKKIALSCLILTCLFKVALCGWYKYVSSEMTWSEARKYCREHHIDLSSIHNQEEDENLLQYPKRRPQVWIGLHKDGNDTWKWSGGENAKFFNWSARQNQSEDNGCVLHGRKGWQKVNCDKKKQFYCFQNNLVLVKEKKTWEEALEHCRDEHNDLVSVPYDSTLVQTLKTSRGAQTGRVWTGLRYLADSWFWVGSENVIYPAWSDAGTPQCPSWSHRCGALSLEGQRLESWDCADKLNFVCDMNT